MAKKEFLDNLFKSTFKSLTFEYKRYEEADAFIANNVTLNGLDDDIMIEIDCFDNGLLLFTVTFDKLPQTGEALGRLMDFNAHTRWFGAYVTESGYLKLRRMVCATNEHDIEDTILTLFSKLIELKEKLLPLTTLTE